MRRLLLPLLLLALLCVGCGTAETAPAETTAQETETEGLPQELIGSWTSADPGELQMVETITFFDDGTLRVSCVYQGADAGTVSGTCHVSGNRLICDITDGAAPYSVEYDFRIDGRELFLSDSDGVAQYLRVS